jgi:DNA-directed RNA polymerase specialized sigma24 family protein
MDADDALRLAEDAFHAKTGKRLNDLQKGIILGILNHRKYADIAEEFDKSEGHVKDMGYELLKLLSSVFKEPVTKTNLKSVLERQKSTRLSIENGGIKIDKNNVGDHAMNCLTVGFNKMIENLNNALNDPDYKQKIKVQKLRNRGFSDEEIAEILETPLELINPSE